MDFKTFTFDTSENLEMTPIDWSSKIASNKESFGQCDMDTAADIINNEEKLKNPATYYMFNPVETDPNGAIKQEELKELYEKDGMGGVVATLVNSRLYPLYAPARRELQEKEATYKQAIFDESSLVNRLYNNFMSSKYAMERKALVSEREQARKINDTELEREYDYKIDKVNKKASEYMSGDDTAAAVANLTASLVRNPELIAVGVIGGAASAASGGVAAPLAIGALTSAAEGAIIYNDTKKVEAGDILEELEEKYPNMTTEERLAISEPYSTYVGGIEALSSILTPIGIGGRAIYRGAKKAAADTFISSAKKARIKAISEAGKEELLKRALKKTATETMSNPNKLAYIGKKVAEHAIGGVTEGAQEVTQQVLEDAYLKAVADVEDPTKENLWQNALDNIQDGSEASKYARIFVDTMAASWIVSGAGAGVSKTVSTGYNKLMAKSSMVDAENVSEKMVEAKKTSEVYKKSPKAYNEQTQILVDVGNAPEKVVFSDVSALRKIKQEAEEAGNTVLVEKMEKAGITEEAMKQAEETTGDLKLDLAKFDEHILDPDNEELFQKVKGLYTFDETTLTKKEMSDILSGVIEARPELKTAIEDTESVFNKTVSALSKNKNFTPAMVIDNAVAAQIKTNRIMEFEGKSPEEANKVSLEIVNTKESLLDKAKGLFQRAGHIAGVYTREGDKNVIKLTEAANPTSFVHEFDHLFWREALESYNSGNMIPYWKKKVEEAAKWVGAEVVDGKADFNTEQMEKLADGFMSYMKEGKSPIASLNDLFARMAEWFVDVYKKLKMSGVKLNEKITKVFDAMLVSREEIDNALVDKLVQAVERKKGVTEEQYQRYISDLSALKQKSTIKHIEALRKKARMELEEQYKDKKAEIRGAVIKELEADRDYQMRAFVRNVRIAEQDIPADMKLKNRELFVAEDGVPVQQVLTEYGDVVSNVGDLVDLLNSLRAPSAVVAERTNDIFVDWLMNENPELAEADARAATANKYLVGVRVKEYLMLKGIPLERYEEYFNNLVKASDEEMANMPISYFMNTDRLMDLETKITTKARFAKSDSELADALWHQAAVDYMLGKAKDIKAKVLKFQKHFDKYKKAQTDADRKNMDAMDFDMISAILYNFRFTGRKPRVRDIPLGVRLDNWVKDKLNNRFSDADMVVDYIPFLTQDRNIKSFDHMQYSDFERIDEMVHEIEDISQSDKKKVELDKRTKRVEDAKKWVNYLKDKKINLSSSAWWTSSTTMMETLLDKNMPRDLFEEYVLKEIDGITMREVRMINNDRALKPMLQRIADNQKKVFKLNLNNRDINLTYEELQVAVLNSDNMETWVASYNKQRMDNLTTEDFIDIVSQAPEQMWEDAKVAWNIFDNQKKDFREAQYRTSGFLMGYVEPRKIKLRDGREIQTGYYPRSKRYEAAEFDSALKSSFGNGGKNMGTAVNAKDRAESGVHGDLDLSVKSLRPTLYHTATVIEIGPAYNALNSLFNDEAVRLAIGEKAYSMLNDWMQYPLVGDHVNKLFSVLDQWSSVQILGWNPRKFFVQALGFIPALSTVGLRWAAPHFMEAQTYTDLFKLEKIKELSPYMKQRYDEAEKYIANITDDYNVAKLGKGIKDAIMPAAMMFTVRGDAFASGIVWRGSYERALAEGKTQERAISWADHVVRTTQGDSTAVSRPPILRGNAKLITKFASYFVAQNSRITSNLVGKRYLEAAVDLVLAGIVSAVVESLISSAYDVGQQAVLSALGLGDDKKKKEMEDFTSYALDKAKKNIWMTLGSLTVPAGGIGSAAGSYIAYGRRYPRELPLYGPINAVMDSINYSIALATAETEKQKQKAKKGLKKTAAQVLTIPREYVNMFITD